MLELKHLCFEAETDDGVRQILKDVSLTVDERMVVITGPNGGGKTTLCHLLSRFWDVDAGQVTLGGHDVREYDMDSLMRNFSFVFQNVYLFHDTIANNICFGQPDAPIEQVIAAAKKARCHDFIMALPDGYDTIVGERGVGLSGGQKQRLSIARAVYRHPEILIFDDSFSALDFKTDRAVRDALEKEAKDSTKLIVAQRIGTIMNADRIIVLDDGKVVGQGTHEELLDTCEVYRQIAESQLSEDELKR